MDDEIKDLISKKFRQYRNRFINLLASSNHPRAMRIAKEWQQLDVAPPIVDRIFIFGLDDLNDNGSSEKICLGLNKLMQAVECVKDKKISLGLERLFEVEASLTEVEAIPKVIKALGKRGGEKKERNRVEEKMKYRRFYRENELFRLSNVDAGKILFNEFEIGELSTAKTYSSKFKLMENATNELVSSLSATLKNHESHAQEKVLDSLSSEIMEKRLTDFRSSLKEIYGRKGEFYINSANFDDGHDAFLMKLRNKIIDEGGL
jgi:hypothetical protein